MSYQKPTLADISLDIESNCCGQAKCNPCAASTHIFWNICLGQDGSVSGTPQTSQLMGQPIL